MMAEDTQEVPQLALEAVIGFNGKVNYEKSLIWLFGR